MTPGQQKIILLVEDEPDLVRGLRDSLEFEGFEVLSASEGHEGIRLARDLSPDLVILDLMLPDTNGFDVCSSIRAHDSVVPIIVLTARSLESDKIRGFDEGADDYVTKPFSVGELIARVKAVFRRLDRTGTHSELLQIGAYEVNLRQHAVMKGKKSWPLTFYEVEMLKLLSERADQPVSRDEILEKIWGIQAHHNNRTVDNVIVKLRRKLEDDQKHPRHILTVHGYGYKLVV
ncbi:MAG: response regulator transcription factor [Pseudomonadota bacterium]